MPRPAHRPPRRTPLPITTRCAMPSQTHTLAHRNPVRRALPDTHPCPSPPGAPCPPRHTPLPITT
eukprot:76491-Chlamydomonas_euryale.AAC.1